MNFTDEYENCVERNYTSSSTRTEETNQCEVRINKNAFFNLVKP